MSSQADPYTRQINIELVSAWSNINNQTIFVELSGWPTYETSEYWVGICLIWYYQQANIRGVVRLTRIHVKWILSGSLPDLALSTRQYWMRGQADPYTRHVNIEWVSAWSNIINKTILDEWSGWPIYTSSKYWVGIRLIPHYQPDNIWWVVRLTHIHVK